MENTEISSSNDSWRKSPTQYRQYRIHIWLVVWNIFYFPLKIWDHPSHWLSYFSERFKPPTRQYCTSDVGLVFLSSRRGLSGGDGPLGDQTIACHRLHLGDATATWIGHRNGAGTLQLGWPESRLKKLRAYNVVELHQQLYYHVLPTFGWLGTNRFGVHIPWRYDDETNRWFFQQHTCWFYLKNQWLNQGKTWWGVEACKVS